MEALIQEFRARAAAAGGVGRRGHPYPAALRALAVRIGRESSRRGVSMKSTARELGVDPSTFYGWCRPPQRSPRPRVALQRVHITPAATTTELVLLLPRGLRVEGLSLDDIAALAAKLA